MQGRRRCGSFSASEAVRGGEPPRATSFQLVARRGGEGGLGSSATAEIAESPPSARRAEWPSPCVPCRARLPETQKNSPAKSAEREDSSAGGT